MPTCARASWPWCLAACLLFSLTHVAHALGTGKPLREFVQQSWQSDTGLPQNTVHALTQTRDGFLWIGTEAGLVRFDGVDFSIYSSANTPTLPSEIITSLVEDSEGSLWIGTAAGLLREHSGVFTDYGHAQGLPAPDVLALYLTQSGRLLALTPKGAAAFDGNRFVPITGTEQLGLTEGTSVVAEEMHGRLWLAGLQGIASLEHGAKKASAPIAINQIGELHALAASSSGEIWVGGSSGLAVLTADGRVRVVPRASLSSEDITSLLPARDGGMWIGSSKGLALASKGIIKPVPELAGMRVDRLFTDRAATLWVTTSGSVARIIDSKVDLPAPKLSLGTVLSIFEDREGNMWFGTDTAGLHVLRDQAFSTITTQDGLSASLVRAVFEDHGGTMWIGTNGGGLDRITAGRISQFGGRLPSKVVLALAATSSAGAHDLWVGTPEGLARIRGPETKVFTTANGLSDDFVRSLYADRDQSLWVGTRNGLSHYKDGAFHSYSKLDGLASDLVGTILRGRRGDLWVGTLSGLSQAKGDTFIEVSPQLDGAVTALLEDHEGFLWIGINGQGLSRWRDHVATSYASANLPRTIYGMLEDANGNLWLSSRTGVDRVNIAALDAYKSGSNLTITHYGAADGMRLSEASGGGHPAAWRAADGRLWFATLDGAAVVQPSAGPRNPVPPLSAIEQVLIDDQPASLNEAAAIRVPAGHGRLSIKYAGLSFVAPQRVTYRYMLQGFDKNWVEAGNRRTAFYTNVPPGSYSFIVRCANSDGVWSLASTKQRFTVEPYFYQAGWFYVALSLALAGLGYLIYHWRVVTVEAQYRAVLEERSRIAREIHDTLAQGYVAVSVQLELAEHLLASSAKAALLQLKQTKQLVREGLAEARSSIWNLRAQSDAEALPSLLATHIASTARRHGKAIKLTVHGAYRPLAHTVEEEVLRIAQEAVANAIAHARATSILVTLNYGVQSFELRVADDGMGMQPADTKPALRGHFGLQGMRERAARIDALLEVNSLPGSGVSILLRVDLQRSVREDAR